MSKDTGGPAFPHDDLNINSALVRAHTGMTLRDYFAAHATEEDIADQMYRIKRIKKAVPDGNGMTRVVSTLPDNARQIARYLHADDMIRASNYESI